jgi:hypothetical protein
MSQNTSTAVMQRRVEAHDSLDDFPTPPWATRALVEKVIWPRYGFAPPEIMKKQAVWEPACNRGHMAKPLREYFGRVYASDIHDYGYEFDGQERVVDFLFPCSESPCIAKNGLDWIITNPPFRLASQFLERSFQLRPRVGVAIIVRTAFLEGIGRYEDLFSKNPPSVVAQFTERVVMVKGRLDPVGSSATAYCWLVWMQGEQPTQMGWIAPCRKSLERTTDYRGAA